MTSKELQSMYGSTPASFRCRIQQSLSQHPKQQAVHSHPLRLALVTALVLMLTAAVGMAALSPRVAELFGGLYGEDRKAEMMAGEIAHSGQSFRLGDVIYTLEEVVYIDNGLYGVGFIRPANENVVLLAEDYAVTDAAGYGLYYGEESRAPEGSPSYAEIAKQKNARILGVHTLPEAIGVDGGTMLELPTLGYSCIPEADGSIRFTFEIPTGIAVTDGITYTIRLWASCQEITLDGEWLESTYLGERWEAVVEPKAAKEMK